MSYRLFCRQDSLPTKYNMVVAAILKFTLTVILNIFVKNLASKTTSRKQIYLQISRVRKYNDGGRHFEIGLVAKSRSL